MKAGIKMHCYIQEIQMKSSNSVGCGKELCVTTSNWTMNGVLYTSYGYTYSDEKFDRPIKTAYKVTLHDKSYRDDKGKVRKKQYHVATIRYYNLVDFGWYDSIRSSKIDELADEMGVDSEIVWAEIENRLDVLEDKVKKEFEQTEEFRTKAKHDSILKEYRKAKHDFSKKYGIQENEYDRCYDIFGVLRKPEYFEKIKHEYEIKRKYEEQRNNYQSSYNNNFGSYEASAFNSGLCRGKEKEYLNKFYKVLAVKFHPDVLGGDNEPMQLVNKLKEQWGI